MYFASAATSVKIHEFPNGNTAHNYQPGAKVDGPIRSISWNNDGTWLALVPQSGFTEIARMKDNLHMAYSIDKIQQPSCAAFEKTNRKNLAVGTKEGEVLVYDVKAMSVRKRFTRATSMITHIDVTPKDTHIAAATRSGDVFLYSNVTNNISSSYKIPRSRSVSALKCNPLKRNLLVAGSNEGVVVVWDTNTSKNKFYLQSHKAPVTAVSFSPINTDLVVSTGLDRQFCFYDIEDKKCIASIAVENSILAVDFSENGTYIIMASQNGRILIYDSRNIQEPITSFSAHNSAIKHVQFQKLPSSNSNSSCSITEEYITQSVGNENCRETKSRTSDLFGTFLPIASNEDSPKITSPSLEGGDSFIAALGLDKNSTIESIKLEEETNTKRMEAKSWSSDRTKFHESVEIVAPLPSNLLRNSSTPIGVTSSSSQYTQSPNLAESSITLADVQAAAKEAVREELKATLEDIKTDIKLHSMNVVSNMRRLCIDLHMAMIKEFIKLENQSNIIKEEMCVDISPGSDSYLVEENANLKKRIAFLEEHISLSLKSINSNNSNNNS